MLLAFRSLLPTAMTPKMVYAAFRTALKEFLHPLLLRSNSFHTHSPEK